MRDDMAKVVTERPRSGGGLKQPKGYNRQQQRYGEDAPQREKIRRKWLGHMGEKDFTDLIGPLYRFLLSQVGRPWDKVYSELSKKLPKNSLQGAHIHTHVWQFVEKDVKMVGKVPCDSATLEPIKSYRRHIQMYINPINGLLCKAKKRMDDWKPDPPVAAGIKVCPGVQYHKIKNAWYEVRVMPHQWNEFNFYFVKDKILECFHKDWREVSRVYGGSYIGISKRQMGKSEIKMAGLV